MTGPVRTVRLPGCVHPIDSPCRPWCPAVLDVVEAEAARRAPAEPPSGDPYAHLIDRYDPDDREPMGGDPYWQENPR